MENIDSVYEKAPSYLIAQKMLPSFVSEAKYWQFYYNHPD